MKSKTEGEQFSGEGVHAALEGKGLRLPGGSGFNWTRVDWYYAFLTENADFFSTADRARILERHLYECMWMAGALTERGLVSRETKVLDAGTGPGLPGFLFHCLDPAPDVTLMDSSRRRLGRLERAAAADPKLHFRYGRLEELTAEEFDIVAIRALVPFPFCVELVARSVRVGGLVVYASTASSLTTKEARLIGELGFVSRETVAAPDLAFLGERFFYLLLKSRRTPYPYPRPWKDIQKAIEQWEKSSPWPTKKAE